jgi:ATP-dependent Clp protease protease subunit
MSDFISSTLPSIIQKTNRGISSISILDDMFSNREIQLVGSIDKETVYSLSMQLLWLEKNNPKEEITIFINSPGGEVSSGLALYDIMQTIKSPVKTVCVGRAASFGTILLLGGEPGFRYIGRNAEVMIHSVSGMNYGDVHTLKEKVDHTLRLNSRIIKLISEKTKLSYKQVKFYTKKQDKYFSADEALKFGLVTEIK